MNFYSISQKLAFVIFLFVAKLIVAQNVWFVDSEISVSGVGTSWAAALKTISEAISAAASGDDILVAYGSDGTTQTYTLSAQLEINNKELRLTSAKNGTDLTYASAQYDSTKVIISGANSYRIFYIHGSNVTNSTVIRGFKLTNGNASSSWEKGGAIYTTSGADPTISNCWIAGNKATTSGTGYGGGIMSEDVSPVITYNLIENNIARDDDGNSGTGANGFGGGIRVQGGSANITYNTIQNNIAGNDDIGGGKGGGISTFNISTTISNNTISNNTAGIGNQDGYGGGISVESWGTHTISNNTISNNVANSGSARGLGGGLSIDYGDYTNPNNHPVYVLNNTFYNNTAATNAGSGVGNHFGGGIWTDRGAVTVKNNIFNHNTALSTSGDATNTAYGGGAYFKNGYIENNTFYANANRSVSGSAGGGSGIYFAYGNWPTTFINNAFVNHNSTARPNSDGIAVYAYGFVLSIQYSAFYNNDNNFGGDAGNGGNNVTTDPKFTNASSGDFTLLYNSPCIDAGSGDYTYNEASNHDYGWKYDIGAEEYSGTRVYKTISGTGEVLFGGKVRSKINVTTQGTLSAIDITVHENSAHTNAANSVKRWYEISATGTGAICNVTLSYKDSELNGETEASLKMYRWNGSSWEGPKSSDASNTSDNYLTCNGQTSFSDWILDADGALPVELTSFTAELIDEKVLLNWSTATEVNNYGFEVERKINLRGQEVQEGEDLEGFVTIGFVEGYGNSNSPKKYSFIDDLSALAENPLTGNAADKLCYRLKQIDTDGTYKYYGTTAEVDLSIITSLEEELTDEGLPTEFSLSQNYPNPFNPTTTIEYSIPVVTGRDLLLQTVELVIYDLLGREIATLVNTKQKPGKYRVHFDGSGLSSGIYFYELTSNNYSKTNKMIFLK